MLVSFASTYICEQTFIYEHRQDQAQISLKDVNLNTANWDFD